MPRSLAIVGSNFPQASTKAAVLGRAAIVFLVPIAGGVVGAGCDGWFVNTCGKTAKDIFTR
ncbi:MAG TPA: hypothetical protein VL134_14215 [Leptolyngbya sp.]|nr:hypothetical protein [Leptolyngbya sp.]